MRGLILCGGHSTRMGTDKGLIKRENATWAEITASKLSFLQTPIIKSVNRSQVETYSKVFPLNELAVDNENIYVKGPLLGLLSVYQKYPGEDFLVLACDMIEMSGQLLEKLVDLGKENLFDAYIYTSNGFVQPLCGIYRSAGLKKIYERYQQEQLKKFSMMHVLDCLNVKFIPTEISFESCFNNYNFPQEVVK